jgi:N-acetylmuramic acid 6-phosphate etherase
MRDERMTEAVHPLAARLDGLSTLAWIEAMHADSRASHAVVRDALPAIAALADLLAERLAAGGRLILAGAGTSGRLAALEAAECPPTFGTRPEQIVALLAGGDAALLHAVEGAEDDVDAGSRAVRDLRAGARDLVVGVSASGSTPFVRGALVAAHAAGATTGAIVCNPGSPIGAMAGRAIVLATGPEFVAGSTRLKAASAQKLALNLLTTGAMRRLGRVRAGRMVALRATNAKLRGRAVRIIQDLAAVDRATAEAVLDAAGGDVAPALDMVDLTHSQPSTRPMADVVLRELVPDDAHLVVELAADPAVVATTAPFAELGGAELFRAWIGMDGVMLGAFAGGRLLGVLLAARPGALLREHVLDIGYVAVRAEARGQGIGDRLLDATLERAVALSLTRVELRVWTDNVHAIRLYERHGFVIEGRLRRHAVVVGTFVDALVMAWLVGDQV